METFKTKETKRNFDLKYDIWYHVINVNSEWLMRDCKTGAKIERWRQDKKNRWRKGILSM